MLWSLSAASWKARRGRGSRDARALYIVIVIIHVYIYIYIYIHSLFIMLPISLAFPTVLSNVWEFLFSFLLFLFFFIFFVLFSNVWEWCAVERRVLQHNIVSDMPFAVRAVPFQHQEWKTTWYVTPQMSKTPRFWTYCRMQWSSVHLSVMFLLAVWGLF